MGESMRFEGKVVIVTGSSRGIGESIARGFAKEGATVVVNYNVNSQLAYEVMSKILELGGNAISIKADVTDSDKVQEMVKNVLSKYGKIDILVNNAGSFKNSLVRNMEKEFWDDVIAVNLSGVFNTTHAVINHMRERKYGKIINITSVQGQTGVVGASNYSAAKAGVCGFTKSVAKEVARSGININCLSLGFIKTGMLLRLPPDLQSSILSMIPMGRFGKPEEVVNTILFLASDDANYITGQVINMNGGYYM